MDWLVVGVPLDAKVQAVERENLGDTLNLWGSSRQEHGLSAVEEAELIQTDYESLGSNTHNDFVILELLADGSLELLTQLNDIGWRRGRCAVGCRVGHLRRIGGWVGRESGVGDAVCIFTSRGCSQLLEANVDRLRDLLKGLAVAI